MKRAMLRESNVKTKVNFKAKEAETNIYVHAYIASCIFCVIQFWVNGDPRVN